MKTFLLRSLFLLFVANSALAADAQLSFFVFKDTLPSAGLVLLVDETNVGSTNDNGRVYVELSPGEHQLKVIENGQTIFQRDILFVDDEVIQLLVNLYADGREPFVDLETSNPDKARTSQQAVVVDEDLPPGLLQGVISSIEDQEPIGNVRVFVSGTTQEARTDDEGRFSFELPPGNYSISVLASSFNTRTIDGVLVQSEQATTQNLELTPAGSELPEFVVIEPYVSGSLASVVEERRQDASVSNILGSEQISKAGDSDAASALKRVTGLTLVDGKFIFIRGLGERYSSTILNGGDVPSPDPTRRVVPLDLFPTSIIDSIGVQKGFTPDQPAEFGGGTVQIRTKTIPDTDFFNIEFSGGYNSATTFKDGLTYDGGGLDFTGYDNGTRAQPDLLADATAGNTRLTRFNPFTGEGFTPEQLEAIGESLDPTYDVTAGNIQPDFGFGISGGMRFDFDDFSLGFQAAIDYDNSWQTTEQVRRSFVLSGEDDLSLRNDFIFDITQQNINLSGFSSIGAEIGENHKISLNSMLLRTTTDEAQIQEGRSAEFDTIIRVPELEFEERELIVYQALGEHLFPILNDAKISWLFTDAEANADTPDFRTYRFEFNDRRETFEFAARPDGNERRFSELADTSQTYKVDLELPIVRYDAFKAKVRGGYSHISKDRDSSIRRFRFAGTGPLANNLDLRSLPSLEDIINPDTIDPLGFVLEDVTQATDTYTAELTNEAFYYGLDFEVGEWLRVYGGLRTEDFNQEVITFDPFSATGAEVPAIIDTKDSLPAVTATIKLPGDHEIRLGYGETVNRPDFKEASPADFVDPLLDRLAIGNADLQPASIKHYDLRWDKYFSELEFVSLGVFYKQFDTPIEAIILPGADRLVSFANAETADNFGVEFEFYKDLSFFGGWWSNLYVSSNFAWIDSSITLAEDTQTVLTSNNRPLQGQSPYVANFQLGYENPDNGITATLLYNSFGERIVQVGTQGLPDIYEQPFQQLDFVYRHRVGDWLYKFSFKNILNDDVQFQQGDEITREFKKGRALSLGIQWSWK